MFPDLIRPTTDRVRETLFNILNNKISFDGIKVLDLYAGSGSLGLECFSRGATEIHFVEKAIRHKGICRNENHSVKEGVIMRKTSFLKVLGIGLFL